MRKYLLAAAAICRIIGAAIAQEGPFTSTGALLSPPSPPITRITITASPFTYTNTLGYSTNVYLVGGTGSNIAFARAATSVNVATACATSGLQLEVGPGDAVTVTYSVAPTAHSIPITPNR